MGVMKVMKEMKVIKVLISLLMVSFIVACSAPGSSGPEKRTSINNMRQQVLNDIYKQNPSVRGEVQSAPGYAVFSNVNINLILLSASGGYGVVVDNASGKNTYMKMGEAGIGFGAGVKDFRALFVFQSKSAMNRFIEHGWQVGGHADAAAKAGGKGGAVAAEGFVDGIKVYQITETGLALQATLKGTKFWRDDSLN
jgi:lipid-binding SYLF domain-containing protein